MSFCLKTLGTNWLVYMDFSLPVWDHSCVEERPKKKKNAKIVHMHFCYMFVFVVQHLQYVLNGLSYTQVWRTNAGSSTVKVSTWPVSSGPHDNKSLQAPTNQRSMEDGLVWRDIWFISKQFAANSQVSRARKDESCADHQMASWEIPIGARKSHSHIYSWLPLLIPCVSEGTLHQLHTYTHMHAALVHLGAS